MKRTKTKQSVRQILTLMLAFIMVFTGMGIGSWGMDTAYAADATETAGEAVDFTVSYEVSGETEGTVTEGTALLKEKDGAWYAVVPTNAQKVIIKQKNGFPVGISNYDDKDWPDSAIAADANAVDWGDYNDGLSYDASTASFSMTKAIIEDWYTMGGADWGGSFFRYGIYLWQDFDKEIFKNLNIVFYDGDNVPPVLRYEYGDTVYVDLNQPFVITKEWLETKFWDIDGSITEYQVSAADGEFEKIVFSDNKYSIDITESTKLSFKAIDDKGSATKNTYDVSFAEKPSDADIARFQELTSLSEEDYVTAKTSTTGWAADENTLWYNGKRSISSVITEIRDITGLGNWWQLDNGSGFWDVYANLRDVQYSGERYKTGQVSKEAMTKALNALEVAADNLLPKKAINTNLMLNNLKHYWVYQDAKIGETTNVKDQISSTTTTAITYEPYRKALAETEAFIEELYRDGSSYDKMETTELQALYDAKLAALIKARDNLVNTEYYEKHYSEKYLPNLDEAKGLLKNFSPEKLGNNQSPVYTDATWNKYLERYNQLKAKCEHEFSVSLNNKHGGTREDFNTVFNFDYQLRYFKEAVNGLQSNEDITATLEYINNIAPIFDKLPSAQASKKSGTDIFAEQEFTLSNGKTTLSDLLTAAGITYYNGSISLSPVSGKSVTVVNGTWLMVLINDEFRGMFPLTGSSNVVTAKNIQIHNGDKVKVIRCASGIGIDERSTGSGETLGTEVAYYATQNIRVLGSSLGQIRIDTISENAKVGEKVTLKASVTGLYGENQGKAMPSEGLALYVSATSESEQPSTDSLKLTTARTDQNGETSYIFREAGDYIIALFDTNEDTLYHESYNQLVNTGDYHGMRAGIYARVHVEAAEAPASLVESSRKENLARAEAFFQQYHDYDFDAGYYESDFQEAYDTLVANQNATEDFKTLMDTFDTDFANLKEKASKVRDHEKIAENVRTALHKLPQTKEELTWRQKDLLKELKKAYERLNDYEKKLLSETEREQIESYLAIDLDSFVEPKAKQILIVNNGFIMGGTNNQSMDYGNYNHVYSSDGYQETKIYPVAYYRFDVAYYPPGTKYANRDEYNENCGNNDRFEPKHKYLRAKSGDRIEIRRMFELLSEDQGGAKYSIDGGKTWKLMRRTLAGEYNGVKTYFVYANFYMPDIEEDSLTVQIAPLTQAEYDAWYAEENQETLDKARADAKTALGAAFAKYEEASYTSANWAAIEKAKADGEAAIDQAASLDEINDAKNQAIAEMAKILTKEQQENASKPSTGDSDRPLPNYGKVVGKVHIILENTTFTKAGSNGAPAWSGTLIDGYYDLCENDTMMTAVLKALQLKGCNWSTGAQGVASSWDDYGISYLASIKVPKNVKADGSNFVLNDASQRLGEFSGESGSGWMGTLNDWFTNFGFQEFGYQNGELKDGDEIHIMFTQNLGVDLGGTWDNSDTTLKNLTISGGTLSPAFNGKTGEYTLTIPDKSANLKVTPTAANKNYQTRIYLNDYLKDSAEYRRTSLIPVKAGDTLYIGCGERAWPSMNKQGAEARAYTGTKYTIKVINSADASAVVKMIDELPAADKITIYSYKSYTAAAANARNAYKNLKAEAQKNVTNYDKLTKVEEKIKFYTEIDDAKAKLHALTAASSSAQAREALAAYNKLSDAQKKYITTLDVEKFNELAKKYNLSSIAGAAEMPESNVTTSGKQTTAILEPTVSDGTANATVDTDTLAAIKKQATEAKSNELTLSVSKDAKGEAVDKVNVKVDVKTLNNLASKQDLALTVSTEIGTLRFDSAALREILTQAGGSELTITIAKKTLGAAEQKLLGDKAAGYTVTVSSGGKSISHFGGNVTVTLEIPDSLTDKKVAAVYIDSADKFTHMPGNKKTISGKAYYVFTTTHFSDFALVDAEALGIEVADEDTLAQVKSLVSDLALTARSAKTAKKNVKVTLKNSAKTKAAIKEIKDLGYTVKYRFYRSTKKSAGYKSAVTKKTANYTNTSGKKNTKYFYKVQVRVYDENGKLVAKTALKQCKYASRVWTKK